MGALHVISRDKDTAERVKSQLSVLQRSEISNPPTHGARIVSLEEERVKTMLTSELQVSLILNDSVLFEEWKRDVGTMARRIKDMRQELYRLLREELKTPGKWEHIVEQIGMFR